jgi:inosose dehydratase
MKAKLGISPIAWWNDDLAEISSDISLEGCLAEARQAGFTGIETGRRFPLDPAVLGPLMRKHDISICGGWFSGLLLRDDIDREKDRIAAQIALFKTMNAPCIVYGETAGTIQGKRRAPLSTRVLFD